MIKQSRNTISHDQDHRVTVIVIVTTVGIIVQGVILDDPIDGGVVVGIGNTVRIIIVGTVDHQIEDTETEGLQIAHLELRLQGNELIHHFFFFFE